MTERMITIIRDGKKQKVKTLGEAIEKLFENKRNGD